MRLLRAADVAVVVAARPVAVADAAGRRDRGRRTATAAGRRRSGRRDRARSSRSRFWSIADGTFLELVDPDGQEAEDVLVDALLALHLGDRRGRRVDVHAA